MSISSVMPSNHLILCRPLLLLPSIFPSIRVFSNESALCIRWPKYWSFSFKISPSNEQSGLISFRMDWLDLLAVQGTLKSLHQYHSSKASWRKAKLWDFPGNPVVKTPHLHCRGPRFNPWSGNQDLTCCMVWAKKEKTHLLAAEWGLNEMGLWRVWFHTGSSILPEPSGPALLSESWNVQGSLAACPS